MPRKFFVGGNWKCNLVGAEADKLVEDLNKAELPENVEIVLAPSFVLLDRVHQKAKKCFEVAAQNCYMKKGAFTGEVNIDQLKDMGIEGVILGHSERRNIFGESDELVGTKAKACLAAGMHILPCIGELEADRVGGRTNEVLARQLDALIANVDDWSRVVLAYEPVWAIGTGRTATPEQAQEAHAFIRKHIAEKVSKDVADGVRILYGGSVNPGNADELATKEDVDGFLVGGASLVAEKFLPIIKAVKSKKN